MKMNLTLIVLISSLTLGVPAASNASDDLYQDCVDKINQIRQDNGLPPLTRWVEMEGCVDESIKMDAEAYLAGEGYGAYHKSMKTGKTCNSLGQMICPEGDLEYVTSSCFDSHWSEGPGGIHHDIMASTEYTHVACGFYEDKNGKMWSHQNFGAPK